MDVREDEKRAAAQAAALLVEEGMAIGLGTGTTVAHFLSALAARGFTGIRCVATSVVTEEAARALGLPVQAFDVLDHLDLTVDGADQIAPDLWLVKGGGGAHTREKVAAAASDRFVVIASTEKLVPAIGPPIPVEVLRFGLRATLGHLGRLAPATVREAPPTPDGNVVVDLEGPVDDPFDLARRLESIPGVVGHGLFPPELTSEALVGRADGAVQRIERGIVLDS